MSDQFTTAIARFDAYNSLDPNKETFDGKTYPKELLYAMRMTKHLDDFVPDAQDYLKLAARCQHIGRWEIPRNAYPMDRKGYLQWRNTLKIHHAKIAESILTVSGFETAMVEKVKFLLLKKELNRNADTQILEDVICLVFVEHYLEEFAAKHEDEKVVDILRKTMKKMSPKAIASVSKIPLSDKIKKLIEAAN